MHLLFDIGGTKTRMAVSEDGVGFREPEIFETPKDFKEGISKMKEVGKTLLNGKRAVSVSGGIAGPLNSKKTKLINAPNLEGWNEKPLHKELFMEFGCKVFVENDTDMAGLGEIFYGPGKNANIVAYFTLSTGFGGSIFANGKVLPNSMGFEPGHQIIDGVNTLEELVGGKYIEKAQGMNPAEIKDAGFWDDITKKAAIGIHNSILHWSPEMVILGGGLITHNAIKIENLEKELKAIMRVFPRLPKLEKSVLEDTGGLFGALVHAKQNL